MLIGNNMWINKVYYKVMEVSASFKLKIKLMSLNSQHLKISITMFYINRVMKNTEKSNNKIIL